MLIRRIGGSGAIAAGLLVTSVCSTVAVAQETAGTLTGSAEGAKSVVVENTSNGFVRKTQVGKDGTYSFFGLPPGHYKVSTSEGGQTEAEVDIVAGISSSLNLSGAVTLKGVTVSAAATANPIDMSSTQVSSTFSATRLQQVPVAQNQNSVALLAPGTIAADTRIGGVSFGGSSAAENSYYVNGLNVSNLLRSLDRSEIPFEAIQSEQVITSGYGPEYGFATGGVISLQTKQGSNTWKTGVSGFWEPRGLSSHRPNSYRNNPYSPTTVGQLQEDNSQENSSSRTGNIFVGGPLIRNKLFFYGIYQVKIDHFDRDDNRRTLLHREITNRSPFALGKLDWNIDERSHLELTAFRDRADGAEGYYRLNYFGSPTTPQGTNRGDFLGTGYSSTGGMSYVGKYTLNVTDNLTTTLQYGQTKYTREQYAVNAYGGLESYQGNLTGAVPGCAVASDFRDTQINPPTTITGCGFLVPNLIAAGSQDVKRNYRGDVEWKLPNDFYGKHVIKGGAEQTDFSSRYGEADEGGSSFTYLNDPNGLEYVETQTFRTSAQVSLTQTGFYLKDEWNPIDRLLVSLGVRNDSFTNRNDKGQAYVSQSDIWQPRLGLAYDVLGDKKVKAYFNYGRYSLPIATNVAIRGAAASVYSLVDQYYTGVDPVTGQPTGLSPVPNDPSLYAFPTTFYINGENGQTPNPGSVADKNLKPYTQDEYILGVQAQVRDDIAVGLQVTHRSLNDAIDDTCDVRPFQEWALARGYSVSSDFSTFYNSFTQNNPGCYLFNPGRGMSVTVDVDGDGRPEAVDLSAADLKEPKAKRVYNALDLSVEKNWSHKWFAQLNYTYAHSYGNTEGQVNSDNGQTDTGTTVTFDFPEFAQGSYGDLPNDHRHTVKLYGAVKPIQDVLVGTNLLFQTGRPKSCFGVNPVDNNGVIGYGAAYFYCSSQNGQGTRGDRGRTDNLYNIDMSLVYTPHQVKGLQLSMDVFNVFNFDTATYQTERGDTRLNVARPEYNAPSQWQTPRYFRFGVRYELQ